MLIRLFVALLWLQLDEIVDPEDGDCGLGGELQTLDLGYRRFEDSGHHVISNGAVRQVEAKVFKGLDLFAARVGLVRVVVGPQLGHEIGGVLSGVDCQSLWDDEQRLGEVRHGKLFPEKNCQLKFQPYTASGLYYR